MVFLHHFHLLVSQVPVHPPMVAFTKIVNPSHKFILSSVCGLDMAILSPLWLHSHCQWTYLPQWANCQPPSSRKYVLWPSPATFLLPYIPILLPSSISQTLPSPPTYPQFTLFQLLTPICPHYSKKHSYQIRNNVR